MNAQQQTRTSPIHVNNKEYSNSLGGGVKKVLEFNNSNSKKINIIEPAEPSSADQPNRDPRLIQRKIKASCPPQQKFQDHHMDTSTSTSNSLSTSPLNKKKQQQQQQSTNSDKPNSINTLKRSSPSNSSIQNAGEIKKPKLTTPVNGETKSSPNKALTSPQSKQHVNSVTKLTPSPPNSKSQLQQSTLTSNKIPKTILLTEENKSTTKSPAKTDSTTKTTNLAALNKSQLNKAATSESNTVSDIAASFKAGATKQSAQKPIPSLFDLQPTPILPNNSQQNPTSAVSTLKKQANPSNVDGKQKQPFNKANSLGGNLTKSKQNQQQQQQQPHNHQQQNQQNKQSLTKQAKKQSQLDGNKLENKQQKKLNKLNENKQTHSEG